MTKIIFVNRFFYPDMSATSQLLTDLAFHMASNDKPVMVITSRELYEQPHTALPKSESVNGVEIRRVWSTQFGRDKLAGRSIDYISFYLSSFCALLRCTKKSDIIVAKTDPPLISVAVSLVAKAKGGLTVNWLQDLFPEIAQELGFKLAMGPLGSLLRHSRNRSLKDAYVNVVLGELMAQRLINMKVTPEKIAIIHNWSDGDVVNPVPVADNPLRHLWRLENKFIVGYSGNLGRAHDIESILEAARILSTQTNIVFLFIGGGIQMQNLKRRAKSMALKNVKFKPYQPREDLSQSLSLADVHLVTLSRELEGLIVPSKFYGILAAGRPTLFVGDPDGEIARIVQREQVGAAVVDFDSEALAKTILELEKNEVARDAMGNRARLLFKSKFSKEHSINAWASILDEAQDQAAG